MDKIDEIENILNESIDFVKENINWKLTEHDLLQFITGKLEQNNFEVSKKNLVLFDQIGDKNNLMDPEKSNVIRKTGELYIRIIYKYKATDEEKTIEKKINLKL
ncbi:MAG: hypothetical protein CL772_02905 [Chloroflexi bacterium]|nr:hypothetical protein [Chloroflexota bacterium]MBK90110.1 hypothetical protein [Chloroflexota bacterium]|tara:strand:- start:7304 stop:7615 length:312 start_codon:yes stop_codon:yes gene_type:complete